MTLIDTYKQPMLMVSRRQFTEAGLAQLIELSNEHHDIMQRSNDRFANFAVMQFTYGFVIGLALESAISCFEKEDIQKLQEEFQLEQSIVDAIVFAQKEGTAWIWIDRDASAIPGLPTYQEEE